MFQIKQIKIFLVIFCLVVLLLAVIEISLKNIFGFNSITKGSVTCKIYDDKKNFSYYKPNCELFYKHWEQKNIIHYKINNFGRRDGSNNSGKKLIAFFGDSFTFGAMVPIDKNYNYKSLENFKKLSYGGHNYGVAGEQFENILSKLKAYDLSKYDIIVYGLTPNDLFDLVNLTTSGSKDKIAHYKTKSEKLFFLKKIKDSILSTTTLKVLLHHLMTIDSIYYKIYLKRIPYSGYLKSPLASDFEGALNIALSQLNELDTNLKKKLVIQLLPQRAEVVAARVGKYNNDFSEKFLEICSKKELICGITDVFKLSKLKESHFIIDGHLNIDGNKLVAEDLTKLLNKKIKSID